MKRSGHYRDLLIRHELLKAQVELRDHYLRFIVREVYDNIGQILSLVRVQIAMMQPANAIGTADDTGNLVGQAIRDLRALCENFFRFEEQLTLDEMIGAIHRELKMSFPGVVMTVHNKPDDFHFNAGLISFYWLKSIFDMLKGTGELLSIKMDYHEHRLCFELLCSERINVESQSPQKGFLEKMDENLNLAERVRMMGGSLVFETSSIPNDMIKLVMPYK